jgi:hypothetical protein
MKKTILLLTALGMLSQTPTARAGDREWATAGKVLTGLFAAKVLHDAVSGPRHHHRVATATVCTTQPGTVLVQQPATIVYQQPPTVIYQTSPAVVYQPQPTVIYQQSSAVPVATTTVPQAAQPTQMQSPQVVPQQPQVVQQVPQVMVQQPQPVIIQQPVVVQQPQVIYGTAPGCVTTTRFFGHRPFGWSHGSYRHGHPRHFRSGSSFSIGFGFCN